MAAQREWYEKDYYKVLGVSDDASQKDITKAYRKLARDSHPDTHPGDAAAEDRFKEVSAAYDVLGDEAKRKEYDEVRRLGPGAAGFVRYLYGAPFAWAITAVWFLALPHDVPDIPARFWPFVTAAGSRAA